MAYRSSSVLAGANGTSAAVPVPAGAAVGDIVTVGIYKENGNAVTAPDGTWTQKAALTTSATTRGSLYVFWKRLTAADTGTYTFTWTGNVWRSAAAGCHSGRASSGDPFDGTVGTAESTTTVSTLNVSTSPAAANGDAVGFWTNFNGGAGFTAPTGYTERQDSSVITLDTLDAVAAGSTGNVTATATVSDFEKAFLGVLAAASSGNSQAITPAAETDTGIGPGASRQKTITPAAETDTGVAPAASRATAVTPAATTDSGVSPAAARATAVAPAAETDVGVSPAGSGIAPAAETDVALTPGRARATAIAPAVEADTALTPGHAKTTTPATETDAGAAAARGQALVLAATTNTGVAPARAQAITPAAETDGALDPGNPNAVRRDLDWTAYIEPGHWWATIDDRYSAEIDPGRWLTEVQSD